MKKVFVTGCFDMLHSGHMRFFQEASQYGDLYVNIGNDKTIEYLKGRKPINSQDERKYVIEGIKYVKECRINRGTGIMDFIENLDAIQPDIFVVNEDGNTPEKKALLKEKGIEYVVLKRSPFADLPVRSTTSIRQEIQIPYRIDLAGGWLDQPFVSQHTKGSVITISIEPTLEFNERSGMATSTRKAAIELWGNKVPNFDYEKHSKILFQHENPPGKKEISGSQDSIGIIYPGLAKIHYNAGEYWPEEIHHIQDDNILDWIEDKLYLLPLGCRQDGYNVLENTNINVNNAKLLAEASELCWLGLVNKDLNSFAKGFLHSFEAQIQMFPNMISPQIQNVIKTLENKALAWKLSGAGGGGYLILVSEMPIENSIKIKVRRNTFL